MTWLRGIVKDYVDTIFLGLGLLFSMVIVPMLLRDLYPIDYTFAALIQSISQHPLIGLPAFAFSVLGISLIIVAVRGLFGAYKTLDERCRAIPIYLFVQTLLLGGIVVGCMAVYEASWMMPPIVGRVLGLIVGVIGAVVLMRQLDATPVVMQWTCVIGGLLGFAFGSAFYLLLYFLIIMFVVQPLARSPVVDKWIGDVLPRKTPTQPVSASNPNQPQIDALRQRIAFIQQQPGIPQNIALDEITRLRKAIRDLGGTS